MFRDHVSEAAWDVVVIVPLSCSVTKSTRKIPFAKRVIKSKLVC